MEFAPHAPAAKSLLDVSAAVSQLIAACEDTIQTQPERVGKGTDPRLSRMEGAAQGLAFQQLKSPASTGTRVLGNADAVSRSDAAMVIPDSEQTGV